MYTGTEYVTKFSPRDDVGFEQAKFLKLKDTYTEQVHTTNKLQYSI